MQKTFYLLFISFLGFAQIPSNLPIVMIDTEGRTIVDEPKVMASMKIINGTLNTINDKPELETKIGIEFRGSSSQSFPKKPYGLESWDANGQEVTISPFGWPMESDWILFASYNEKSLMHNVLAMKIGQRMGMYASRTKYVELYLNGRYEGVYVFMEKLKRDKGRVDIAKLEPNEESGEDLTGGYIIKIDKGTGTNIGGWKSNYSNQTEFFKPTEFFYEYPKDISTIQKNYIKDYVSSFENALMSKNYTDTFEGYQKFIDMKTFVKMTILNEVTRNVDGYRISTFLYKDKNDKLKMGPPWDYDISFGNANYCNGSSPEGFSYNFNFYCKNDNWQVPFWWSRFLGDVNFIREFRYEYEDLRRNGILQEKELMGLIDGMATELKDAQKRNFERWPILGNYIWPQPEPISSTWEGEVNELKTWLAKRLIWLDNNIPKEMSVLATEIVPTFKVIAYPNPFLEKLSIEINSEDEGVAHVSMNDLQGKEMLNQTIQIYKGRNQLNLEFPEHQSTQTLKLLRVELDGKVNIQKVLRN